MADRWREVKIGALCNGVFDGPHATPKKTREGPVFLGISSLNNGRLDLSTTEHISEPDFVLWTRRILPQQDDIVFSYETRLGEAAIIPSGLRCCLGRRMALMRPDPTKVHPRFLLYCYIGPEFQQTIRSRTVHGSTVDRIPLLEFPSFGIRIPDINTQKAIASILGALDDKIELNRQRNRTLEAMARALFQSWFVDFDPVKAKAAGKQPPGLKPEIAALFPKSFGECETGTMPHGWRVGNVFDLCELLSGGTPDTTKSSYWNGEIKWASAKDVSQCGQLFLVSTERTITLEGVENSATKIIPEMSTVVVARGATTGRMAIFGAAIAMNQTCYALRSKNGNHCFLNQFLQFNLPKIVHTAHGSVFDTITTASFKQAKLQIPSEVLAGAFEKIAEPLYNEILRSTIESNALKNMRDTLLPKLVSGQLKLQHAERIASRLL